MANHESWLDIPALLAAIPVQVRFLAKKSLFSVPFLGWAMLGDGVHPGRPREPARRRCKSFEEAAARIRAGRSVLLFPEETRTTDGSLLPLQRGGFLIALKAAIPIVPVGLDGARRCLPQAQLPDAARARSRCVSAIRFPTAGRGVTEKDGADGDGPERDRAVARQFRRRAWRPVAAGRSGGASDGH